MFRVCMVIGELHTAWHTRVSADGHSSLPSAVHKENKRTFDPMLPPISEAIYTSCYTALSRLRFTTSSSVRYSD